MNDLQVPNIGYREATVSDCVAIAQVHVQSWKQSFAGIVPQAFLDNMSVEKRAKAFESRFSEVSYKMYVAEAAGHSVVGFADFGEPREKIGNYEGELYAIYLLVEFQRKGIGAQLFNQGVEFLIRSGKSSMYLLALEVSPYKSFYEKMGGQVIGRKRIEIEGVMYDELVYGWKNLG
jgi:ribosomal protein S18 acetylase RimI-like enzyme